MKNKTTKRRTQSATLFLGIILFPAASHAATLVSHWTMNNPSPYSNEVSGGPEMIADGSTRTPATFDSNETRLEQDFGTPRSTRLSATGATLNLNTFSFSMIVDPTDVGDYTSFIQKESGASNTFADFKRVGWQVIHTTAGNIEFSVRGTDPGAKDYYGGITVTGATSGFTAGNSFSDPATYYQIAGGYDATTGAAYLYVTTLGATLTDLTGGTATFDTGAVQDSSALSLGSAKSGSDFIYNGSGFDVADVQIYNNLLTKPELLVLANNPGQAVPEPSAALLGGLGVLCLLRRRR